MSAVVGGRVLAWKLTWICRTNRGVIWRGLGGRRPQGKRKKDKKERKKEGNYEYNVKLLHNIIKCCFFQFFNSPVALKNKNKIWPPQEIVEKTLLRTNTEYNYFIIFHCSVHHPSIGCEDLDNFINSRLKEVDEDPNAPPYDTVREYAYEGSVTTNHSLSSIESSSDGGASRGCCDRKRSEQLKITSGGDCNQKRIEVVNKKLNENNRIGVTATDLWMNSISVNNKLNLCHTI